MAKHNIGTPSTPATKGSATPPAAPPVVPPATPPAAPPASPPAATAPAANGAAKPKRAEQPYEYPTAEACMTEAKARLKGRKRAFKCWFKRADGTEVTKYLVAYNHDQAAWHFVELAKLDEVFKVEELGVERAPKAPKVVGVGGVMEAINSLPEADRAAVMAQLAALVGQVPAAKPAS